jgi:hypothetical protein
MRFHYMCWLLLHRPAGPVELLARLPQAEGPRDHLRRGVRLASQHGPRVVRVQPPVDRIVGQNEVARGRRLLQGCARGGVQLVPVLLEQSQLLVDDVPRVLLGLKHVAGGPQRRPVPFILGRVLQRVALLLDEALVLRGRPLLAQLHMLILKHHESLLVLRHLAGEAFDRVLGRGRLTPAGARRLRGEDAHRVGARRVLEGLLQNRVEAVGRRVFQSGA